MDFSDHEVDSITVGVTRNVHQSHSNSGNSDVGHISEYQNHLILANTHLCEENDVFVSLTGNPAATLVDGLCYTPARINPNDTRPLVNGSILLAHPGTVWPRHKRILFNFANVYAEFKLKEFIRAFII